MNRSIRICLLAATVGAGVVLSAAPAVADSATVTYAGSAYGSAVRLGTLVRSGHTSQVSICTPSGDTSKANNTAAVTVPNVGRIGAVVTRLRTVSSPAESIADSRTDGTNLFSGMVRAQGISAHATVTQNGTGYATAGQTTIFGLVINNQRVTTHPAPNSSIGLPGVGKVILNQQSTSSDFGLTSSTVTAIVVVVAPNNSRGLPAGTIMISSATAGLHQPTFNRAVGDAYATSVRVGPVLKSGQTAFVAIACGGNNGEISRNNIESSMITDVLTTGNLNTTATSSDSATVTSTTTSARVEGFSLFGGQVRAATIYTRASAVRQNGVNAYGASGTTFSKLVLNGRTISGTPPRNTAISVPGLGTVYLNVVSVSGQTVHAQGLRIVLGAAQGGLPAGAVINVAVADAGVFD